MSTDTKKDQAQQIFMAAIEAVHPSKIIPSYLSLNEGRLLVGEQLFPFSNFESIYVAGAGKATAAMAAEVEKIPYQLYRAEK